VRDHRELIEEEGIGREPKDFFHTHSETILYAAAVTPLTFMVLMIALRVALLAVVINEGFMMEGLVKCAWEAWWGCYC